MRAMTASLLALFSIGVAYAAPATSGSPLRDMTVSYNCNGSQPDTSSWMIQGQSEDNHWVRFESKTDPQVVPYDGVLFIEVQTQADRPPHDVEIGHILGPAACEPADDGSGFGNSFEPAYLDVMLDGDVSVSIVPGTQLCPPYEFNSGTLNTLVVNVDGATYSIQPTSCN